MGRTDLLRYTGNLQQIAYARRICYDEGRARGLHAVEVVNGPMRFGIMLDKCMDVSELSWRGEQISFLSKPGLNGRNPFDTHGAEAQRSIMGGLFSPVAMRISAHRIRIRMENTIPCTAE